MLENVCGVERTTYTKPTGCNEYYSKNKLILKGKKNNQKVFQFIIIKKTEIEEETIKTQERIGVRKEPDNEVVMNRV